VFPNTQFLTSAGASAPGGITIPLALNATMLFAARAPGSSSSPAPEFAATVLLISTAAEPSRQETPGPADPVITHP
jgi:hypothetical protein